MHKVDNHPIVILSFKPGPDVEMYRSPLKKIFDQRERQVLPKAFFVQPVLRLKEYVGNL